MGHGAPLILHHGSAITGREHGLLGGYEFDLQEGVAINKQLAGTGFLNLPIVYPAKCSQASDEIMGKCLDHRGDGSAVVGSCGGVGVAAGITQVTRLAGTFCISFMIRSNPAVQGFIVKGYGAAGGATRHYLTTTAAGSVAPTIGATALAGVTVTKNKWYRACVTWEGTYGEWFLDGVSIASSDALAFPSDITELFIGILNATGVQGIDGRTSDFTWGNRRYTAADALRDYMEYATRAHYAEYLRAAHVSSTATNNGRLENTHWWVDAINGTDFRVGFDLASEQIIGVKGVKYLQCNGRGYAWIPTQRLGMSAADPEAAFGTWDFWVYRTAGNEQNIYFVSTTNNSGTTTGYNIRMNAADVLFLQEVGTGNLFWTAAGYVPADQWVHIRVVRRFDGWFWVYMNDALVVAGGGGTNPVQGVAVLSGSYLLAELYGGDRLAAITHRCGEVL